MTQPAEMNLEQRIASLNEVELKQVYGRLMIHFEEPSGSLLTGPELESREQQNEAFLLDVANNLQITPPAQRESEHEAAIRFLTTIAREIPECRQVIAEAMDELEDEENINLDFGLTAFAASILVTSIAVAIVRPRVEYKETKQGDTSEKKFVFEVVGNEDLKGIIKAVFPFLTR